MAKPKAEKIIRANVTTKNVIKGRVVSGGTVSAHVSQGSSVVKATASGAPSATETKKGIVRIATVEEVIEGVNDKAVVTPYTLRAASRCTFTQGMASDTWVIIHNLNTEPSVTVVDTAGKVQIPNEIIYDSKNQVTVQFLSEFAGKAYLN